MSSRAAGRVPVRRCEQIAWCKHLTHEPRRSLQAGHQSGGGRLDRPIDNSSLDFWMIRARSSRSVCSRLFTRPIRSLGASCVASTTRSWQGYRRAAMPRFRPYERMMLCRRPFFPFLLVHCSVFLSSSFFSFRSRVTCSANRVALRGFRLAYYWLDLFRLRGSVPLVPSCSLVGGVIYLVHPSWENCTRPSKM